MGRVNGAAPDAPQCVGLWGRRSGQDTDAAPTFTYSKSYITVLVFDSPSSTKKGLVDNLLRAFQHLVLQFQNPTHIYSHRSVTFLDNILDSVDSVAKDTALLQCRPLLVGCIVDVQEPTPCFVVNGVQHHDVCAHIERETARVYCHTFSVDHHPRDASLHVYVSLVMRGKVTSCEHLRCITLRHDIPPPRPHIALCVNLCGP